MALMRQPAEDPSELTKSLAARIFGVAREHRRERLVLELVCIEWELSHLDCERRAEIEECLARTFSVPSFGRVLEESVLGRSTSGEWALLFSTLGL